VVELAPPAKQIRLKVKDCSCPPGKLGHGIRPGGFLGVAGPVLLSSGGLPGHPPDTMISGELQATTASMPWLVCGV